MSLQATFGLPVHVSERDTTAEVGRLMAEVGRRIGNQITTLIAQNPGDYDIDFAVVVTKLEA